ncbi:MAG: hypothetical protein KDK35_20075 [Leptospiraceae bacterium]|nr:hypothetical protein [Leptospiraceae bacterium]MCP5485161.1 hypothetical protein [Spirochaetales bacterium]
MFNPWNNMKNAGMLLSIDSLAGLSAGIVTLSLSSILAHWYGWPMAFVLFVGWVNIGYGCYSGVLAILFRKRQMLARSAIIALVLENSLWAGQCLTQVWWRQESATVLGLGILAFEALFVLGLAYLEARIILPHAK